VILLAAVAIAFNETVRWLEARCSASERDELRRGKSRRRHRGCGALVYAGREGQMPALEDIALTVGAGRFVVIVGPSGCGRPRC
jgi:ABC-type bacteriocin/lantibiotic exporter with double-glycine peptidase domain